MSAGLDAVVALAGRSGRALAASSAYGVSGGALAYLAAMLAGSTNADAWAYAAGGLAGLMLQLGVLPGAELRAFKMRKRALRYAAREYLEGNITGEQFDQLDKAATDAWVRALKGSVD